jgi:hypothetical protein
MPSYGNKSLRIEREVGLFCKGRSRGVVLELWWRVLELWIVGDRIVVKGNNIRSRLIVS